MNALSPIFTARTECQDCYKCIRECPVKAVKVEAGYASVISTACICCGHCVEICPNGAKKVRNDRPRAEKLLASKRRTVVSLAPSFASEFPTLRPGQLIAAIKRLGFFGVSETALGAQQVSAHSAELLDRSPGRVLFSSACPSVVDYIRKYQPAYAGHITPLLSPLLTHCRILREVYGPDTAVVFIGPCIAKKREADQHPELLEAALTFEDLKDWFRKQRIAPEKLQETDADVFVPEPAAEGALYPVEGGMLTGIQANCGATSARFMSFSGIRNIAGAVAGVEELQPAQGLFCELLACDGGCINGPKAANGPAAAKRYRVIDYSRRPGPSETRTPQGSIAEDYPPQPLPPATDTEAQIREVLRLVGKSSPEDELNCGGCGYDSCRQFAQAFLRGRAERQMCVTYMRTLAQKKTHALMKKMPSAAVIVDENLNILECNPNFIRFFAPEDPPEDQPSGLEGVALNTLVPFYNLFQTVLRSGEDILDKDIRHRGRVFHSAIFSIEKNSIAGGIFLDVTKPSVRKEQIIERARQVVQKNLHTVQQIAYLMGENAAESEIALNSIIDSFSLDNLEPDAPESNNHGGNQP